MLELCDEQTKLVFRHASPKIFTNMYTKHTLENQAHLRDNDLVIAGAHWDDGQQAARMR